MKISPLQKKKEIKSSLHRRNTRILFSGLTERKKAARKYALKFCEYILNIGKNKKQQKGKEETEQNSFNYCESTRDYILASIDNYTVRTFLKAFFDEDYPIELSKVIANLLKVLNGTASLCNFFPRKDRLWLHETFETLKDTTLSDLERHFCMKRLHSFRVQFNEVMKVATRHQKQKEMASFFQFLLQKTEDIHKNDTQMPDDPEILDAYDPTRGVSYNFTPHGGQIRNLPKYKIQGDTQIAQILF